MIFHYFLSKDFSKLYVILHFTDFTSFIVLLKEVILYFIWLITKRQLHREVNSCHFFYIMNEQR